MNNRSKSWKLSSLIVTFPWLFATAGLQGMNLYTYDLDSLVYMSPEIVEGKLGNEHSTNNVTVQSLKISAAHRGRLQVGQSIDVTALDFYSVSHKGFWGGDKLKDGDQVFLFLDRAKNTFLYPIPANAEVYWAAPSDVRLVVGQKALGFAQFNNPGPYLAVLEGAATNSAILTVPQFRDQIRESIRRVDHWKPLLEKQPALNDIPALLEVLRKEKENGGTAAPRSITELMCKSLATLQDVSALTNALAIDDHLWWILGGGFYTPAGRQFLWSNITNENNIGQTRAQWARVLQKAGQGTPEEHHLKHLAEFAACPGQDPELRTILLDSLRQLENWRRFTQAGERPGTKTQVTIDEAAAVLKAFTSKTDSQETQYQIDLVLAEFNGEKEGIISILKPGGYDASKRRLSYHYDILVWAGTNIISKLVFQNVKTGTEWAVPAERTPKLSGHSQAGGNDDVTLPNDLPKGHYHVFYEFLQDGRVVGRSHYFETEL